MQALTRQTFKIFWQHSRKHKLLLFVMTSTLLAANAVEVYIPFWYKRLFDTLAAGGNLSDLRLIILVILGLNGFLWLFWRLSLFALGDFQPRVMAALYNSVYKYLHGHSYQFFTNNFGGSLVRKVSRFSESFEVVTDNIYDLLGQAFVRLVFIVGVLAFFNPAFAILVTAWTVLFMISQIAFNRFKLPYDLRTAAADTAVSGHLADTIVNNINLKLFGGFGREQKRFESLTEDYARKMRLGFFLSQWSEAVQSALMILLEFAVLYFALGYWSRGDLSVGDFALLQAYLIQLFTVLWGVGRLIRRTYEKLADANEMTQILLEDHQIKDKPDAGELQISSGEIEYANVEFAYGGKKKILDNFNLRVNGGEKLALIGPSGGGKTTIVKLLFRFFDLDRGRIMIDGQNIAAVTQESLRTNLSLVPQEPILFHRTLMDNIRYARPEATDEEVFAAARLAHCHEFIAEFPDQYNTYVGERGVKLSGGERQRVAIARAILKNAPILVLDEATSSLDSESEHLIQDALKNLMRGKTTIVIAHRLSTIMQMDRIVVIENGTVTEEGSHHELLKASQGTYQRLWQIQAGGFDSSE